MHEVSVVYKSLRKNRVVRVLCKDLPETLALLAKLNAEEKHLIKYIVVSYLG